MTTAEKTSTLPPVTTYQMTARRLPINPQILSLMVDSKISYPLAREQTDPVFFETFQEGEIEMQFGYNGIGILEVRHAGRKVYPM